MEKEKKQNRENRYGKKNSRISSRIKGTLFTPICILLVILQIVTQWSCMDTLLPICIPWMYYQYVVLGVFLLSFMINPIKKHFQNPSLIKKSTMDYYEWAIAVALVIVPAFIFLPNRHIPIEPRKELRGNTINQTSASINKSSSSARNYVKIKLDQENTCFWYCINKDSIPLGNKCIVYTRRGIFGMRYVEKVDFQ